MPRSAKKTKAKTEGKTGAGQVPGAAGDRPPELEVILEATLERKARDPVLLDLRGLSDAADWFLIASGDSDTHARAIADHILDRARAAGVRPVGIEGKGRASWILLDYISVVVHVFLPQVRDFYRLEELWGDAPATRIADVPPAEG